MPAPSTVLTDRFAQAVAYATTAHADHSRKGGTIAYASHLLEAAGLAVQFGGTEDQAIVALLHDVVEDQGGLPRLEDVSNVFGDDVAEMVEILSDSDSDDPETKALWIDRKEHHLVELGRLAGSGHPAVLVAACDKISNARAVVVDVAAGKDVFALFKGQQYGTAWYYRNMHDALAPGLPPAAAAALRLACRDVIEAAGQDWDAVAGPVDRTRLPAKAGGDEAGRG